MDEGYSGTPPEGDGNTTGTVPVRTTALLDELRSHPPHALVKLLGDANQRLEDAILDRFYASVDAGAELRRIREDHGNSLRGVAKLVGISPMYLSDMERGRRLLDEKMIVRILAFA